MKKPAHGFTLIELLIVISIIAILAAVGMIVYSTAQKNGRISKRIQDLRSISIALEVYKAANGNYPCSRNSNCAAGTATTGSTAWGARSICASWNPSGINNTNVIPGFVPQYMPAIPSDPAMDPVNSKNCYIYQSDGIDYKILLQNGTADMAVSDFQKQPQLIDPVMSGVSSNPCTSANSNSTTTGGPTGWSIYSSNTNQGGGIMGAECW